ncbi:hypothetical protein Tco_1236872 [Tanacetum coccineum]
MSDSEDSTVTYTPVSIPFEGLSDIGSPGVDGPPMMLEDPYAYMVAAFQALPSSDYMPSPEEPEQAPLSPEFVPEPVYPEFMPSEDEVFPTKEQPLRTAVSPTANSPGYIADSDLEEHEEDPEEDLTDYHADGGDDDDGDDESFNDDEDDDDVDEEDEDKEEEENPTPADSVPPHVHCVTAKMSIRDEPLTPFWSEAEISRLLAIPSPLPLPLSPWSSPLPQIPSPPLLVSPPLQVSLPLPVSPPPLPASPTYPLRFRAAMIRQRAESPSTSHSLPLPPPIILSHTRASVSMIRDAAPSTYILVSRSETPPSGTPPLLPIPLPTPSPPLLLPSTDRRADMLEVCLPPRKRLCIALGPRYEIRCDPERYVGYGITNTWNDIVEDMQGTPTMTDVAGLSQRMTNFVTTVRQDTNEIYVRLDDAQDNRSLISGWLNMLFRDRRAHDRTTLLMEKEARLSHKAWGRSMDASDTACLEVRALRTTILVQQTEIAALQAADRA